MSTQETPGFNSPISSSFVHDNGIWAGQTAVYNSFSGTDITAMIVVPGQGYMVLGDLQTISYSIHRENKPVRVIGHVNVAGFTKGPRTIAGSLIFTQFDQYTFYKLKHWQRVISNGMYPLADMLPPFDVVLTYSNEYGLFAKERIYGITIVDEGSTRSIDDLITEQTFHYMARGIEPLTQFLPEGYEKPSLSEGPVRSSTIGFRSPL